MNLKKQIPLSLRKIIEDNFKGKYHLFTITPSSSTNVLLSIKESDEASRFYFWINDIVVRNSKTYYTISYMPTNSENMEAYSESVLLDSLERALSGWINRVEAYNEKSIIFDDPIIQKYYNDLEPDFQIVDEDAEYSPYSYEQQDKLLELYDKAKILIEENRNSDNSEYAQIILDEINKAETTIHIEPKKQVVNRVRTITAMCMKYGRNVAKAIIAEFLVEVGKRLFLGG